jgi:hypothetical protein
MNSYCDEEIYSLLNAVENSSHNYLLDLESNLKT